MWVCGNFPGHVCTWVCVNHLLRSLPCFYSTSTYSCTCSVSSPLICSFSQTPQGLWLAIFFSTSARILLTIWTKWSLGSLCPINRLVCNLILLKVGNMPEPAHGRTYGGWKEMRCFCFETLRESKTVTYYGSSCKSWAAHRTSYQFNLIQFKFKFNFTYLEPNHNNCCLKVFIIIIIITFPHGAFAFRLSFNQTK